MGEIYNRFLNKVKERKQRASEGFVNSIPSPFVRFSDDLIGIEQSKAYLISAFAKGGKSQFTSFYFVFNPLIYAYQNPDKVRVKFFMYLLEETPESMVARLTSYLIYLMSNGKKVVNKETILSTKQGEVLSDDILNMMESKEITDIIDFFESHTFFSSSTNATGVRNECIAYAKSNGITHTKTKKYKDELGETKEVQGFDYYENNDPDEYRIIIVDHISLLSTERGFTLKQSIDKLGEYCIELRDRYHFTPVIIQQQSTENESNEALKMNRVRPTVVGLSDSKYMARNVDIMLGVFSPIRFDLKEYFGYSIDKFRDNIRFLEVVLNRSGRMGGVVALYFNGACSAFQELPLPNTPEIQQWYNWLDNNRKTNKSFILIKRKKR